MRTRPWLRPALLAGALLTLSACGGGGGGGGGGPGPGTGPEIEVFTSNAAVTLGGTADMGVIAQTQFVAVPVFVRNTGNVALAITGAVVVVGTDCTATLRDAPPAAIAAGDTSHFTVLVKAGTTGAPSAVITIPNDDANENPFTLTITFTLNTATHVTYTAPGMNGTNLYASAVPGAPGTVQVNGAVGLGASGVSDNWHLIDRTLYQAQPAAGGPRDLYLRGLGGAAPVAETNLTTSITNSNGSFVAVKFAAGDNLVFAYNRGPGLTTRVYSMTITGGAFTAPQEISGAEPIGSAGASEVVVSPRKDLVAFVGDFLTAGRNEVFLVPFGGGTRVRIGNPAVGRNVAPGSVRWLGDNSGITYETVDAVSGQQREVWLSRLGPPAVETRLNGAVPGGLAGVLPNSVQISAAGTHVWWLTDENGGAGRLDLYVSTILGGSISGPLIPTGPLGTNGVSAFGIDPDGRKALLTVDTGMGQERELWQSLIAGGAHTTTKIVARAAANRQVAISGSASIVSKNVAWYVHDDTVAGRNEAFFLDWSTPAPTSTRLIDNTVFTGGVGVQAISTDVKAQPDLHVVISSNQGNPGGLNVFGATLSAAPGAVRLNSLLFASNPTVLGLRVAYEADAGAIPQNCWANLVTGGAENQSGTGGSMVGAPVLFSESRVFWHTFSPNLFHASTTAAATQQDTDQIGGSDIGSVRVGHEPRP